MVRMPDGTRQGRRFRKSEPVQVQNCPFLSLLLFASFLNVKDNSVKCSSCSTLLMLILKWFLALTDWLVINSLPLPLFIILFFLKIHWGYLYFDLLWRLYLGSLIIHEWITQFDISYLYIINVNISNMKLFLFCSVLWKDLY